MSLEIIGKISEMGTKIVKEASEKVKGTAEKVNGAEYDPDERNECFDVEKAPENKSSKTEYDPDDRLESNDEPSEKSGEKEEYDPDDRLINEADNRDSAAEQETDNEAHAPEQEPVEDNSNQHEGVYQETKDGKTYYYDDNGKLYRIDDDLLPNSEYELNGYKYTTDEKGRIVHVEGNLHMKDREGRLPIKDSLESIGKGDEKPTDDRGHLIGDQFDGSNGLENMVPQDADINRTDFRNFEKELADKVKEGKEVKVEIDVVYDEDSRRPSAIIVKYTIDGEEHVKIFPNN